MEKDSLNMIMIPFKVSLRSPAKISGTIDFNTTVSALSVNEAIAQAKNKAIEIFPDNKEWDVNVVEEL